MGRPKVSEELKRETVTVRLPKHLLEELYRCEGSTGRVVEKALIEYFSKGKKNPQPRGRTEDCNKEENKQYLTREGN